MEIKQDRKVKDQEPDGVSDSVPGTRWGAEQEPRAVEAGLASASDAEPEAADAEQDAAADEEDKTRITNNEQMNDEGGSEPSALDIPCSVFGITTQGGISCRDKTKQAPKGWGR